MSARVHGACALVVVALVAGCELKPPNFGRPCDADHACVDDYVCFDGACVAPAFPLLEHDDGGPPESDAGESDAGESDAGESDAGVEVAGENCANAMPLALDTLV